MLDLQACRRLAHLAGGGTAREQDAAASRHPLDALPFEEVWAVDFEFGSEPGENPAPVCLVAWELKRGRKIRLWRDQFGVAPPYPTDANALFVAYYASAEIGCHLALGWPPFRSTRGYSIAAALLDELAFWSVDEASAEPDVEIINAVRPGMATIPGSVLLCASSPYARRGELWNAHRRHFGKDGDPVLCWSAATRSMNPSVWQCASTRRGWSFAVGSQGQGRHSRPFGRSRCDHPAWISLCSIHDAEYLDLGRGIDHPAPAMKRSASSRANCAPTGMILVVCPAKKTSRRKKRAASQP